MDDAEDVETDASEESEKSAEMEKIADTGTTTDDSIATDPVDTISTEGTRVDTSGEVASAHPDAPASVGDTTLQDADIPPSEESSSNGDVGASAAGLADGQSTTRQTLPSEGTTTMHFCTGIPRR